MKNFWMMAALALLLTACAEQDETTDDAAELENGANEPSDLASDDADTLREAMRDPEQRQALLEAMRERRSERREARTDDPERAGLRERMRERRGAVTGEREDSGEARERLRERRGAGGEAWESETLISALGIDDSQARALGERHREVRQTRRQSRQSLAQSQRGILQALREGEREQARELIEERMQTAAALQQAEARWMEALFEALDDEQIATLAREHPRLLAPR